MNNFTSRFDPKVLSRSIIGFDRFLDDIERRFLSTTETTNYPPFNIIKTDEDSYVIELAATGFTKSEIKVRVESKQLIIEASSSKDDDATSQYIYRGLASRNFVRRFDLADNIEVYDASIRDGLLRVYVKRILPESEKPRLIEIKE